MPLTFDHPSALWTGLVVAAAALVAGLYRRPAVPGLAALLAVAALVLLAVAAGGPVWRGAAAEAVTVMVDLSPSTRTARYRDPGALRERVHQLLGDTPYRTVYFAAGEAPPADVVAGATLSDVPAGRTVWSPPAAAAVLLFSDARFDPPAFAPPTHVVVDPALEEAADAAVERLEARGGELAVTVRNAGGPRPMTVTAPGPPAATTIEVPAGGTVVTRPLPPDATQEMTARLARGDPWPENDVLSVLPPPPPEVERWWVGNSAGPDGWRTRAPRDLPSDAAAYLRPSVIVLDNVPASDLGDPARRRLREYVAQLGGGLVILGGDAAFAAGGYGGTALDAISPLSSHPPQPSTHWVFLVDSSGSMNAPASGAGGTRWAAAVEAVGRSADSLPPQDLVSVAGFAGGVEWWVRGKSAANLGTLPPPGSRASGPTELRRALQAAATPGASGPPVELVVLTDANAPVGDAGGLAALMRARKVRLHLLDIGDASGAGLPALRQVVGATGGTVLRESDPAGWAAAVRRLTRAATPDLLVREPARVEFAGPLAGTAGRTIAPPWNRTWLKAQATAVANGSPGAGPLAATWAVGEGTVVAAAFAAPAGDAEPFVRLAARPPRDPGLRVAWESGARLRVTVNAVGDGASGGPPTFVNSQSLVLEIRETAASTSAATVTASVPQVAPGRYETSVEAPTSAAFATLRAGGRVVDRLAIPGRYPAEYDGIGNDRPAMRALAGRTGGSMVEPFATAPLPLPRARRRVPLASPLAGAAAACLAAALVRWRAA